MPCRVQPAAPPRQSGHTAYNRARTGIGRGELRKAKEGLREGVLSLPLFVNWTKAIPHNKITNHKLALSFHAISLGAKACLFSAYSRLVSRLCLIPQDQGPPGAPRTLGTSAGSILKKPEANYTQQVSKGTARCYNEEDYIHCNSLEILYKKPSCTNYCCTR